MRKSNQMVAVTLCGLVAMLAEIGTIRAVPTDAEPMGSVSSAESGGDEMVESPEPRIGMTSKPRSSLTQKGEIPSSEERQEVLTVGGDCTSTAPILPTLEQLVAMMAELAPLPKVHYSYPMHPTLLGDPDSPLLYHYVRLTRSVGLSSAAKNWQIATAVDVCDQINALGDGAARATIAINHSPWHISYPASLPPTYTGPEADAEIAVYRTRLTAIRDQIAVQNALLDSDVTVGAILLNSERFYPKQPTEPGAAEYNVAILAKYTPFYDIAKEFFPEARVEWYGLGIQESAAKSGWSRFPWFTFDEPSDTLSCALYRVSELGTMRDTYRRSVSLAAELGYGEVTPWIALGSGYRRDTVAFQTWSQDWNYDTVYSLLLGRELNQKWYSTQPDRFAPWSAAKVVVFYPSPFDPRTPSWGKHFIAYARGAVNRNDLP